MIQIKNPSSCSGCTACMAVCAHDAISMQPDALGFKYPHVDVNRCVDCGLCEKICPFHHTHEQHGVLEKPIAFASRHKNIDEIKSSRSGATFVALSDYILDEGGAVYGAGFSERFEVIHKRATTKEERDEFRGSKYVQSDLTNIFHSVKRDLQGGLKVLFSGTPCQIAGLKAFIGERLRGNLYLADIVCHGVASPSVWKDYLNFIEKKEKDRLVSVNFRDKNIFGWSGLHKESFKFGHKGLRTYDYTFYNSYMLRRSCNACVFANTHRPSDITLGDFWGWEKVVPGFNADDRGVSLILCNTQKGIDLFNSVYSQLNVIPVKLEDCLQPNLIAPTPIDANRDMFEMDYSRKGFKYVRKKYGEVGLRFQVKRIARFVKRTLNI